jgi:regulator of nucleoside diphosphate kinase
MFAPRETMKLKTKENLCVTNHDRCRLGTWLSRPEARSWGHPQALTDLEALLEEAEPVSARLAPQSLVTMNTEVKLEDLATEKRRIVTLVYPDDVDLVADGVSILEPLGTALLGCQAGDVIQCPDKECQRRYRIDKVVYQPERAGASHL